MASPCSLGTTGRNAERCIQGRRKADPSPLRSRKKAPRDDTVWGLACAAGSTSRRPVAALSGFGIPLASLGFAFPRGKPLGTGGICLGPDWTAIRRLDSHNHHKMLFPGIPSQPARVQPFHESCIIRMVSYCPAIHTGRRRQGRRLGARA